MNLPEKIGWEQRPIGSLFQHRVHATTAEEHAPLSVTKEGVIDQLSDVAVSEFGAPKKLVRAGDLVINSRSDRKGSSGLALRDGSVSVINTVLKPRAIDPGFAMHLLRSRWFQEEFYRFGSGIVADLWSTRYQAMKTIRIPVPNTQTQRAIADYLDHETAEIDALASDLSGALAFTRERQKARLEQIVWDSQTASAPLRRFIRRVDQGHSPSASAVPASAGEEGVLKAGCTNNGSFDPNANKRLIDGTSLPRASRVHDGDLLVTRASGSIKHVGSCAIVENLDRQLYLSDKIYRLHVLESHSSQYLSVAMQTHAFREKLELNISGAQGLARNISLAALMELRIPLVDKSREESIATRYLDLKSAQLAAEQDLTRAITLAKERRAALITAAVTGQIDVTAKHRPAAEQLEDDIKELT